MAEPLEVRGFNVKFSEAIDYLKAKLPETSQAWDDLAGPVHAKVFTVTGATKADLVRDIHQSLTSAIENGTTITAFRKDFDKAVQDHGWEYKGKRGWRTSVIFDTNMRSAHMAGRWSQIQAGKDRRPFLQYRTAGDARVRPQHRMWNGLIYAVDDVFWQTHYPPNGWGCRCTVRAYSQTDLDSKDLQVAQPFDNKTREVITRDGEIKDRVPIGIDPGWDHNVGQSWLSPELALGQKLARLPRELQGIVVDRTISPAFEKVMNDGFKAFRSTVKATAKPTGAAQIVGFLDSATLQALADQVPALDLQSTAVAVLDRKTIHLTGAHKAQAKPQQAWPDDWIDALPENFRNYRAVLWDVKNETLVVVPQGNYNTASTGITPTPVPKIVLRPNVSSKYGTALSVVSLGAASKPDLLKSGQYMLLVGKL